LILDDYAVAGGAGVAAGAAVAVGDEIMVWGIFAGGVFAIGKERLGCGAVRGCGMQSSLQRELRLARNCGIAEENLCHRGHRRYTGS
jgi:hypothetical protein